MSIQDFLGNQWDCDCLGCSIGNGSIIPPGGIIKTTNHFVLHQDPEIPIHGFLIVASRDHIKLMKKGSVN